MKIKRKIYGVIKYALVLMMIVVSLFPIWWMLNISLKTVNEALLIPPKLIYKPTLKNYREVIFGVERQDNEGRWVPTTRDFPMQLLNSAIVGFSSTALALVAGIPAAYALAKFKFRKRKLISTFILSTRFVPPIIVVIPLFIVFRSLGLLDTLWALIIVYTFMNLSLVIWMLRGFFDEIPSELIDSAKIDGCTPFGTLRRIAIPLTFPGIAASAILSLIVSWNEFLFAVIFTSRYAKTAPLGVQGYITVREVAWSNMAAAGIIITIPVLIFTIICQKHLAQGLTAGAVKG